MLPAACSICSVKVKGRANMSSGFVSAAYIIAAILFIFSLAGLSKQETAKRGNVFGMVGMGIALFVTVFGPNTQGLVWILIAMVIGAAIGIHRARKVEMTQMPELIAILHSFGGLAAVLVAITATSSQAKWRPTCTPSTWWKCIWASSSAR